MIETLRRLLADDRSATTTTEALAYLNELFLTPRSVGIGLAVTALRGLLPETTVTAAISAYASEVSTAMGR